jgi:hypothetical protein
VRRLAQAGPDARSPAALPATPGDSADTDLRPARFGKRAQAAAHSAPKARAAAPNDPLQGAAAFES